MLKRDCEYCGKPIPPESRIDKRYCNKACRTEASRLRRRGQPRHPPPPVPILSPPRRPGPTTPPHTPVEIFPKDFDLAAATPEDITLLFEKGVPVTLINTLLRYKLEQEKARWAREAAERQARDNGTEKEEVVDERDRKRIAALARAIARDRHA